MRYNLFLFILTFTLLISCNKNEAKKDANDIPDENNDTQRVNPTTINNTNIKDKLTSQDTLVQRTEKSINDSSIYIKDKKRKADSLKSSTENDVKLLAYYFHPTARCETCLNIEAYSLDAIEQWEKKNKRNIKWYTVNIEDSVNEHYINEYNLEFSSLIIVKYSGKEKTGWKNLEDTWKTVKDKSTFTKYVQNELDNFIKEN